MTTYQVEYCNPRCWEHDWRWIFMKAHDDEEVAWKAENWTKANGFKLIDIKPIQGHET